VFAQVRISLINTVFTGIYLMVILPMAGVHLPLTKSMVLITFVAGLIPVAGNIISNTVIVIIAMSHSLHTAFSSLLFMVVIHKLEYFLNARIIGAQVNARAWELLTAILVMEPCLVFQVWLPHRCFTPISNESYVTQAWSERDLERLRS